MSSCEIVNFHRIAGPHGAARLQRGNGRREDELRDNAELVACLMACLRKMYGQNIPRAGGPSRHSMERGPLQSRLVLLRACRLQAEFAPTDRGTVKNLVFFAGEATSQFFPATVHGAFLSGVRAAYEIMLADAKVDLMKDGQGEVDTYV